MQLAHELGNACNSFGNRVELLPEMKRFHADVTGAFSREMFKGGQRGPRDTKGSQREPKVSPKEAKGTPKTHNASQRDKIYSQTPDQQPQRTLCYVFTC